MGLTFSNIVTNLVLSKGIERKLIVELKKKELNLSLLLAKILDN